MIEKVREIPPKYYQLVLFNVGLIIAITKGYSILHVASSLAFITVLAAPIAIYFKILEQGKVQIVHEAIQAKICKLWSSSVDFLKNWNEVEQKKRTKFITYALLLLYISVNFICPCIQTFIIANILFVYIFMQEEVERMSHWACNVCSGCCESND